jgi:CRP/FNR family transcriptional regulator, cyclic AMP receptor protein
MELQMAATPPRQFDPLAFLASVGSGKTITTHKPGEIIFKQGSHAELVYYLQKGKAKETVESEQGGKDAVVGMLEPGFFFGTSALDGAGARLSTVVAVTTCVVTAITISAMKKVLKEPRFTQLFVAYLLHHNSQIEAEKVDLLFNSSEKRLARKLLILAHVGEGPAQIIGPEITQEMLSTMIGTTRPRVNHFLNKFRKLGFIKYNGGIMVQPSLLKAVLQETPTIEGEGP